MIVIYIIVAVIGSFICTLIKVKIDEWLEDSSMNRQSRLSLKRIRYDKPYAINDDPVEISDDESVELLPSLQKSTEQEKHTNITSHEVVDISNNMADTLNSECTSKHMHDVSSDLASDEDIIVLDDVPSTSCKNTSCKGQSMFNWNNTSSAHRIRYQSNIFPENTSCDSRKFKKDMLKEINKKQKLMDDLIDDDDFVNLPKFEKDLEKIFASPPKVAIQHDIMIAGTKVKFPAKPYSCQLAVMHSLIQGCHKEQNCLLESPTGSGKTLALLCGSLAWQDQYSEKIHREQINGEEMDAESSCCGDSFGDSVEDNFFLNSSQYFDDEWCDKVLKKSKARRVPKIYYGTRTHKQIEQVIRELKKTAYKNKRMTILSSRKITCIQNTNQDKNELCKELLDPLQKKECIYYNELNKRNMTSFSELETPWDIEDLVSEGKKVSACPYFGARDLMAEAEIIFCPYNYIVNPDIRESMQINLKGDIIILDEAHNVEDTCREAASVSLRNDNLAMVAEECRMLLFPVNNCDTYSIIEIFLKDFLKFLENVNVKESDNGQIFSDYWLGVEFLELLHINNIGRSRFPTFLAASKAAIEDFEKNMKDEFRRDKIFHKNIISSDAKKILQHLCFAMQMIMSDVFVNDYRVHVIETMEPTKFVTEDVWLSKKKNKIRTVKFTCMNPAVVFAPLARTVHSIILASGTLAPTLSFQSELGTQFPHIVNPDHIVPKDQVYVRCIPRGPNGKTLIATYENVNSWNFQDELGNLILQVCDAVPYGVLCFFSSYTVMYKHHERWKDNGMWNKLLKLKEIFVEPRDNMDKIMKQYRKVIKESSSKSFRVASGAILFAVFRGKVAEGIDFSDNEARCVLTIGIPYSYKKDAEVSMKIKYNDANTSKGLLTGSEWYAINAFRALNQALGRCVRHKKDWGAVLLVDERLQRPNNMNYLPKWIKTKWLHNDNYDLQTELEDFVAIQVARERGESCRSHKKD